VQTILFHCSTAFRTLIPVIVLSNRVMTILLVFEVGQDRWSRRKPCVKWIYGGICSATHDATLQAAVTCRQESAREAQQGQATRSDIAPKYIHVALCHAGASYLDGFLEPTSVWTGSPRES
jgi:hypothetical protein